MLSPEQIRTIAPGMSISTAALIPKVCSERVKFVALTVSEELDGTLLVKFKKTYFGVFMGPAQVRLSITGEATWQV